MPLLPSPTDHTSALLTAAYEAMRTNGNESLLTIAIRDAIKAEIAATTGTGTATGAMAGGPGVPVVI